MFGSFSEEFPMGVAMWFDNDACINKYGVLEDGLAVLTHNMWEYPLQIINESRRLTLNATIFVGGSKVASVVVPPSLSGPLDGYRRETAIYLVHKEWCAKIRTPRFRKERWVQIGETPVLIEAVIEASDGSSVFLGRRVRFAVNRTFYEHAELVPRCASA